MCSITEADIAELGQAIEELAAAAARSRSGAGQRASGDASADADRVVVRLAELWARLAEIEPDIARRLPTYRV